MVGHPDNCYFCLCEVCSNTQCPSGRHWFHSSLDFCLRSLMRGACPRYKCDFFIPKYRRKVYKLKRSTREDQIMNALNDISRRLGVLEDKVK